MDLQDLENNIPQSAWEMVAPNIGQDDTITHLQGFSMLQNEQKENENTTDIVCDDNARNKRDTLSILYAKAAKRQDEISGLLQICMHLKQRPTAYSNVQQSMVQELHKCSKTWRKASRIQNFSEWSGGTGKSHIVHLIQRDMSNFFKHTVKPDDDQPNVLITAPTG